MAQLPHTQTTSDAAVKDGHKDISLLFIQHDTLKTNIQVCLTSCDHGRTLLVVWLVQNLARSDGS